jgi:hypothetical protein
MAAKIAFCSFFLVAQWCIRRGAFLDRQPGHSLLINHLVQVVCLDFVFSIV